MANPQKENGYTIIANAIMEAFARTRIRGEARQVLDCILRKTYGYRKRVDNISLSQFMLATGLPKIAVCKAVRHLCRLNIITKKGNQDIPSYSLNKDFDTWKPLPKKVIITKKGNHRYPKRKSSLPKKQTTKETTTKETITKDIHVGIIEYLNQKTKKNFRTTTPKTKDLIKARWNEGFGLEDFKKVIDVKVLQWLKKPDMCLYLRPETLFGTKFESYLNEWKPPYKPKTVLVKPKEKKPISPEELKILKAKGDVALRKLGRIPGKAFRPSEKHEGGEPTKIGEIGK